METRNSTLLVSLFEAHHASLCRFLTRILRCEHAAADTAQEAYVRMLRFAPRSELKNPRAYLFQIAANIARNELAQRKRRGDVLSEAPIPEAMPSDEPDAEALALANDKLRRFLDAVDDLPPRCREVFMMSRFDGLTHGEISLELGISRNMVEKHIIKAILHCRHRLADRDG